MKFLTVLILILSISLAFGQGYQDYDAKALYDNSNSTGTFDVADSTIFDATLGFVAVNTLTTADSATSRSVYNNGYNDKTVIIQIDSLSGTTSTEYFFGRYQGAEYGWTWASMGTLTADAGKIKWNVGEQPWAPYEVIQVWAIKFEETGSQRNKHGIRIVELKD